MKKIITLSIVFLLSFIVFCIIKLPAAVAIDLAKPYFPKQLEVGQSVGTIWQGQMMQVRYQGEQLNNVRWDVAGWALFTGKLNANVKFGDPRERSDISGYADVSFGLFNKQVKVTNGLVRSTVERAMQRIQLPLPVTAKGRVILELAEYTSGAPYCESLQGEIASPNIDVQGLNGWFNIGPLGGNLSCKSGDIAILIDPDNTLGLEADAILKANFDFKVSGYVKPDATLPKDVHDAVKFLGRPDNQGRYPLNF
ncbi:general secretion pathway protein N [Pseudoalteromonas translucida KMM 520]|uniref:Type II secretion system protein N n=1 Tax=Pseudoalteromonas translucida KMM 520 TaxID=1315283 RepID=A0A0U2VDN8_9GAMM|nr:type II secretion system protein N [Pseudoalteromonas translucida]ALS31637.1 general secretion pathway protein N [Pseudoalteromonas translucida KMM 520]